MICQLYLVLKPRRYSCASRDTDSLRPGCGVEHLAAGHRFCAKRVQQLTISTRICRLRWAKQRRRGSGRRSSCRRRGGRRTSCEWRRSLTQSTTCVAPGCQWNADAHLKIQPVPLAKHSALHLFIICSSLAVCVCSPKHHVWRHSCIEPAACSRLLQAASAQQRIRELVTEVKAQRLPAAEALRRVRQIENEWGAGNAVSRVDGAGSGEESEPAFKPVVGQRVAVRSMGGSAGTVMSTGNKVGTILQLSFCS